MDCIVEFWYIYIPHHTVYLLKINNVICDYQMLVEIKCVMPPNKCFMYRNLFHSCYHIMSVFDLRKCQHIFLSFYISFVCILLTHWVSYFILLHNKLFMFRASILHNLL